MSASPAQLIACGNAAAIGWADATATCEASETSDQQEARRDTVTASLPPIEATVDRNAVAILGATASAGGESPEPASPEDPASEEPETDAEVDAPEVDDPSGGDAVAGTGSDSPDESPVAVGDHQVVADALPFTGVNLAGLTLMGMVLFGKGLILDGGVKPFGDEDHHG